MLGLERLFLRFAAAHRGFFFVGLAISLALVVLMPFPEQTRLAQALHNAAHGPLFAVVAIVCARGLKPQESAAGRAQYAGASVLAVGLAAFSEIVQIPFARDASLMDLLNDVLGATAGLGIVGFYDRGLARPLRLSAAFGAILLGLVVLLPLVPVAAVYAKVYATFPVLADFSERSIVRPATAQSAQVEQVRLTEPWATVSDEYVLRVHFIDVPWSGISFDDVVGDWRGYSTLAIDLTNPSPTPLGVIVRVHDLEHDQRYEDRFNTELRLASSTRHVVRISLDVIKAGPTQRFLDMSEIAGLAVFRAPGERGEDVYISRIWLE